MGLNFDIKKRREELGYTQKEISEACNVSEATVSRWESGGIINMKRDKISKLAKILQVKPSDIIGESTEVHQPKAKESPLEKKYNTLDAHGKKVVDFVLDAEYQRCIGKDETSVPKTRIVPLFRAAAGKGEPTDGVPFEDYEILAPVPGEFAVQISGDSMEPEYHHGDIVMCTKKIPDPGEIGVIMVDGFLLVKQVLADNKGIYLHSFNKDYEDISLLYEGNDTVSSYGTVIRKKGSR